MASFMINTRAELMKSRKTAAYFIAIIAGVFVPFINLLMLVFKPDHFTKVYEHDAWKILLRNCWQPTAAFLLPTFVILLTSLVVQVENRNNTWKQVYASPRSYADIFFSKFVIVHLLILTSIVLFNVSMLLVGYIANAVHSDYHFFSQSVPWSDILTTSSKMYVSILGMTAAQYWLSLRLKNYIAPLGIGLAFLITSLMLMQWDKVVYFPYAYTAITYFNEPVRDSLAHLHYSYIWFVGLLLLAFWDTVKRKERG
jgi:lantibiotic transport system permease protein